MTELLTKETFFEKVFNFEKNKEWKFEGELPCVIDFYADWCGPCKMMAPHIESVKKKYGEKLTILKVDTDKSIAIGQHFNITGIPLVKVYFEGKEVYDRVGYHKEEELETILKSYL